MLTDWNTNTLFTDVNNWLQWYPSKIVEFTGFGSEKIGTKPLNKNDKQYMIDQA